jgi:hypothetical protein
MGEIRWPRNLPERRVNGARAAMWYVMEPGSLVMERKMPLGILGIKDRLTQITPSP